MHHFDSVIYKIGINAVVDVPLEITNDMVPDKGYIRIQGDITGFDFKTTLVPVKGKPYRLFVNIPMLKGGKAALGNKAVFSIEQDFTPAEKNYPMNEVLLQQLRDKTLLEAFEALSPARKKDILKYLSYVKTEGTLYRNVDKVIKQLENNEKNVRIP